MAKVSVVIPIYNIESYLKQCLDSVVNQTMHDIEIILVDDGSCDGSGRICDEYSKQDKRIKVIHKENEGLSCARNDGIDAATSEYIMFVDGDDWVEPDYCETPYKIADENNADMVLFAYNQIHDDGRVIKRAPNLEEGLMNEDLALRYNVCFQCCAWIGLYRKSLFDQVRFPEKLFYEDVGTAHRLIHLSQKIIYCKAYLCNHRISRVGSITTNPNSRCIPDLKIMQSRRINDLCSWGYEKYAIRDTLSILIRYGWKDSEQKQYVDLAHQRKELFPQELKWKQKAMFAVFKFSPRLFDKICIAMNERI